MKRIHPLFLISILLSYSGCQSNKVERTTPAFYYWKGSFSIEENSADYLSDLSVTKLYIKFFDVDFDSNPYVKNDIYFSTKIPQSITEIVPVAFITNHTIKSIDSIGIEDLSQKIMIRFNNEIKRTQIGSKVSEIQIDCDWTNATRNKYFYLLSLIKQSTKYTLSATIRLHQYKYHNNNLPPIDKGLLMCYNVDNITDYNVTNSLFSKSEVMKYIEGVKYPITLDLALPAFGWGVIFNASQQFDGITEHISLKDLQSDTSFTATNRENVFKANIEDYKYGHYWNMNDLVRVENIELKDVEEIKTYLINKLNNPVPNIILFHFDKENLDHFKTDEIKVILNTKK